MVPRKFYAFRPYFTGTEGVFYAVNEWRDDPIPPFLTLCTHLYAVGHTGVASLALRAIHLRRSLRPA